MSEQTGDEGELGNRGNEKKKKTGIQSTFLFTHHRYVFLGASLIWSSLLCMCVSTVYFRQRSIMTSEKYKDDQDFCDIDVQDEIDFHDFIGIFAASYWILEFIICLLSLTYFCRPAYWFVGAIATFSTYASLFWLVVFGWLQLSTPSLFLTPVSFIFGLTAVLKALLIWMLTETFQLRTVAMEKAKERRIARNLAMHCACSPRKKLTQKGDHVEHSTEKKIINPVWTTRALKNEDLSV